MKRIIAVIIAVFMLVSVLAFGVSADPIVTDSTWSKITLKPFLNVVSGMIYETEEFFEHGNNTMRGFTVSPDGKYAFLGLLNPGNTSAVNMVSLEDGTIKGDYQWMQPDGSVSYCKGLDADDRGYLYVGLAYYPNYGAAHFAIVDTNNDMKELNVTKICEESTPGDQSGTQVGINGVDVVNIGGEYYMYVVVNYAIDRLYRYNVTNPSSPVLDTNFGTNGYVDLQKTHKLTEGNYLDVDGDGTIYLGVTYSGGAGMYVLSADGNTKLNEYKCSKGYAVGLYNDYVLVTTQSGPTCVHVLNKTTLAEVATLDAHTSEDFGTANSYVYVKVVDDILYVANQGGSNGSETVVAVGLTDDAEAVVASRLEKILSQAEESESETESQVPPESESDTVAETPKDSDAQTEEPSGDTSAPATVNTEEPGKVTEAPKNPEQSSGCSSAVVSGAAVVVMAIAAAAALKKKH